MSAINKICVLLLLAMATSKSSVEALPGAGSCRWFSGVIVLNETAMKTTECVALGGNCCDWYCPNCLGCCWNDSVGAWEDPAVMNPNIRCQGCYVV